MIYKKIFNAELEESIQDPSQLFVYRFNNNDPINKNVEPKSEKTYMTRLSDWMELFNIKSPKQYFRHGKGGLFGNTPMAHDIKFDYGRSQRRAVIWNRIKTESQIFGPYILFSVGKKKDFNMQSSVNLYPISTSILQGATSVHQIIGNILNEGYYVSVSNSTENPLKLDILIRSYLTQSQESVLKRALKGFQKHTIEGVGDPQRYRIKFQIQQCKVTFWFGFDIPSSLTYVVSILSQEQRSL